MSIESRDHEAHYKIETHEKVCTERYGNIWAALQRIETTILTYNSSADLRMTALSNRMWALVIGGGSAAFIGLSVVIFHLITRGKL